MATNSQLTGGQPLLQTTAAAIQEQLTPSKLGADMLALLVRWRQRTAALKQQQQRSTIAFSDSVLTRLVEWRQRAKTTETSHYSAVAVRQTVNEVVAEVMERDEAETESTACEEVVLIEESEVMFAEASDNTQTIVDEVIEVISATEVTASDPKVRSASTAEVKLVVTRAEETAAEEMAAEGTAAEETAAEEMAEEETAAEETAAEETAAEETAAEETAAEETSAEVTAAEESDGKVDKLSQ